MGLRVGWGPQRAAVLTKGVAGDRGSRATGQYDGRRGDKVGSRARRDLYLSCSALIAVLVVIASWSVLGCAPGAGDTFESCLSPDFIAIRGVRVQADSVGIQGDTSSSSLHFEKSVWTIRGGVLTVGFIYTPLTTRSNLGSFDVTIPTNGASISRVVISGGGTEERVY
jgi:hypothetical protein